LRHTARTASKFPSLTADHNQTVQRRWLVFKSATGNGEKRSRSPLSFFGGTRHLRKSVPASWPVAATHVPGRKLRQNRVVRLRQESQFVFGVVGPSNRLKIPEQSTTNSPPGTNDTFGSKRLPAGSWPFRFRH
jgi:hypothetical protein